MPKKPQDYSGRRIGSVVAIRPVGRNHHGKVLWELRCDCETLKTVIGTDFARGNYQSCGCGRGALISKSRTVHGMSDHPVYWVWRSMIDRCTLPTHQAWTNYGGRGITVCDRWREFSAFWEDMGPSYVPGLTLDRANNELGYFPGNCRWVTHTIQARNKRGNRFIDTQAFGRITIKEAAERVGLNYTTLLYRIDSGCPTELALALPPDPSQHLP
jgi:hypothetical protein